MTEWSIDEDPRRSWKNHAYDTMSCYLSMKGRVPLGELLDHFAEKYPHVDPRELQLNYVTIKWEETPTAEEVAKLEAWRADREQRQERWERQTYERLKAKYAD